MLVGKPQPTEDLKFANYFKEIFLDSDTKVACISGAPSEIPEGWFLTNEMKAEARAKVNKEAGTRRMAAAVNCLAIEPMSKTVSAVNGSRCSRSARP
jgi:hypothetical protein